MKFTCTQENLQLGMSLTSKLPGSSVGLPILNNVLLSVKDGVLRISATNLETGIVTSVRGKSGGGGGFTVDAKMLYDYVSILPKSNVVLELVKGQLSLVCENFSTKIRGQSADEFPIIPSMKKDWCISLGVSDFREKLVKTMFAVSLDSMRPEITGVYFVVEGGSVTMVATDSYRLAETKLSVVGEGSSGARKFIVPLRVLQELERILSVVASEDETVEFSVDENQVMFEVGSTTVVSKLINGEYPDYKQIIPVDFVSVASVSRADLIQATRASSLFARSGVNDVTVEFVPGKDKIRVSTANTQVGEQEVGIFGDVSGESVSVTLNYKYMLDGLQALSGDVVDVSVSGSSFPVVITSKKDPEHLYLVMPIKK